MRGIGADGQTVVVFQDLMDSKSLFLTANCDTIYSISVLDLTNGPMVIEIPPGALGGVDDMWFQWVTDMGAPGPDRGEGGKYLIVGPDYTGVLPDSGYHMARQKPGA